MQVSTQTGNQWTFTVKPVLRDHLFYIESGHQRQVAFFMESFSYLHILSHDVLLYIVTYIICPQFLK